MSNMPCKTTINMKLPDSLFKDLDIYAQFHGIKIPAAIAFLLHNQVILHKTNKNNFEKRLNRRRFKTSDDSAVIQRSIKVSESLHNSLFDIADEYTLKTNELIINMLRTELEIRFQDFSVEQRLSNQKVQREHFLNVPTSDLCLVSIQNLADSIGISVNMLIAQIVGEYVRTTGESDYS